MGRPRCVVLHRSFQRWIWRGYCCKLPNKRWRRSGPRIGTNGGITGNAAMKGYANILSILTALRALLYSLAFWSGCRDGWGLRWIFWMSNLVSLWKSGPDLQIVVNLTILILIIHYKANHSNSLKLLCELVSISLVKYCDELIFDRLGLN